MNKCIVINFEIKKKLDFINTLHGWVRLFAVLFFTLQESDNVGKNFELNLIIIPDANENVTNYSNATVTLLYKKRATTASEEFQNAKEDLIGENERVFKGGRDCNSQETFKNFASFLRDCYSPILSSIAWVGWVKNFHFHGGHRNKYTCSGSVKIASARKKLLN